MASERPSLDFNNVDHADGRPSYQRVSSTKMIKREPDKR